MFDVKMAEKSAPLVVLKESGVEWANPELYW
jgi:hypothetical protein